jgi:PAS domain S-box-containing protein
VEKDKRYSDVATEALSSLNERVRIECASTIREADISLNSFIPDIAISDYVLPDGKGLELLQRGDAFPVILLAENGDEELAVEAIKAGAMDYIVKSEEALHEMPHRIKRALREWKVFIENKKLKESYRTLLNNSLQGVAVFAGAKLMFVNDRAAAYSGYTVQELLSLSSEELGATVLEEYRESFGSCILAVQSNGQPQRIEIRSYHKSGSIIWIDMYLSRIEFNGMPAVQISSLDITDKKLAELEIKELNARLEEKIKNRTLELEITNSALKQEIIARDKAGRSLQEAFDEINDLYNNAPCGYHSLDKNGEFLKINDTELKWLGYTREEVINKLNIKDILTRESRDQFNINFPFFLQRGYVNDLEFVLARKDGSTFPVIISATAVKDKNGNFTMSRSTLFDVTELRKAKEELQVARYELEIRVEQRTLQLKKANDLLSFEINQRIAMENTLRESEERFRKIYEEASIGIYRSTTDGKVLMANPALIKMLGYPSFSALASISIEADGYEDREVRKKFMEIMETQGEVKGFESIWRKYDGTKIHVIESSRAVKDSRGKILYYEGAVEDLTARKKLEESFLKAKEEAEKSNKLKSEFLAQMSHEIRTPLNSVLSLISLVEEEVHDKISDDTKMSFDLIKRGGKRLIRTVELILNMAEIQTDSYDYSPAVFDLYNEILKELIYEFKLSAKNKNVTFRVRKETESSVIYADKYSVFQTLSNLIDNAIKYTQEGYVEIGLKCNKDNATVFYVKDSGVGISEEYKPNMFSLFSQEEQGYTRRFEGNGLGLALVKKYCEMNNAQIEFNSEKGKGSEFTIIFPPVEEGTNKQSAKEIIYKEK